MATLVQPVPSARLAVTGQRFYARMALAFIAIAVAGFGPTYWIPLFRGTLVISPIAHLHALFFYGWTILFLAQTSLAASGRLARHRELGVAGVAVATGMVFVGLGMSINSLKRAEAAGLGDAGLGFSIVSVSAIALFAALFAAAIVNVRKPEVHKRLMLVATASLLQAAVGRWFLLLLAPRPAEGVALNIPPLPVTLLPGIVVDLLIVAAMIHDRRTIGRVHRAYWIAGATVLAVQVLRVPLAATGAWHTLARWLLAVAP